MSTDFTNPVDADNVAGADNQCQHRAGNDPGHGDQRETPSNGTKTATLYLPYFTQGDDLSEYLENTGNVGEALEVHACEMDLAAAMLRSIKETISGHEVSIEADTHFISLTGPVKVIDGLIGEGLLTEPDEDDEDETMTTSRKMNVGDWKPIGCVFVDTAQLLLIDPIHTGIPTPDFEDQEIVVDKDVTGVVVSTGWGDGNYLVEGRYARDKQDHGQILAEIRVRFLDEDGNQVCYEHK